MKLRSESYTFTSDEMVFTNIFALNYLSFILIIHLMQIFPHSKVRFHLITPLLIFFIFISCNSETQFDIPENVRELENVRVFPFDPESVPKLELIKEMQFGNTDDVIIGIVERMSAFDQNRIYKRIAADEHGRVFIADIQQLKIHIFDSDGTWLQSLGRQGRGPGEFQQISKIDIVSNQLYTIDANQRRINVFSLDSLNLSHSITLIPQNKSQFEELSNRFPDHYLIRSDGSVLTGFFTPPFLTENPQSPDSLLFYDMDRSGQIQSDRILSQQGFIFYTGSGEHQNSMFSFDFTPKSLRVLSGDDHIFANLSDEFLIKVYNPEGDYIRAIYYPFDKIEINQTDLINRENRGEPYRQIIRQIDLPETHAVIRNMLMDDENQLWISTFTNSDDTDNWWVLNKEGEMVGRFSLSRDKWIREIKNNRVYTIETNFDSGEFDIVRYRVENIK